MQKILFKKILPVAEVLIQYIKKRKLFFFVLLGGIITMFVFEQVDQEYLVTIPREGGSVTEAVIGSPRFINPVLAFSQADKDMVSLVFEGLFTADPDGNAIASLAADYVESQDKKEYIVTIRDDALFHDGESVNADDVIFTINQIQNPVIKSPLYPNWLGITVEKVSDKEVLFILDKPYPLFLDGLRLGILPKHLWEELSAEEFPFSNQNISPVGAGPYMLSSVGRGLNEKITGYTLTAFRDGIFSPYIDTFKIVFVEDADEQLASFEDKRVSNISGVDAARVSSLSTSNSLIQTYPLPRVFALFFNQQKNKALAFSEVREIFGNIIDRHTIITDVFDGNAIAIDSPLPPTSPYYQTDIVEANDITEEDVQEIIDRLGKNSWSFDEEKEIWHKTVKDERLELSFDLWVPDSEDLVVAANHIRNDLARVNIPLNVKTASGFDLEQNIVRKRDFDILLFGYITGIPEDIFSFWHSSGRIDPGLNISSYVNIGVDDSLEDIKRGLDEEQLQKAYSKVQTEIKKDSPATFLFSPKFIYITDEDVLYGEAIGQIAFPEDRFRTISSWYIKTEQILPFFAK